jgi:MFS family permease
MRQEALAPGFTSAQTISVLAGSSVMLTMSMGMRQSWGLFSVPITQDLGISIADFMLAIAIQNLVWGMTQPLIGAYADKFGCRLVAILGTLLYAAGIGVTMAATGTLMLIIGLGVMVASRCLVPR